MTRNQGEGAICDTSFVADCDPVKSPGARLFRGWHSERKLFTQATGVHCRHRVRIARVPSAVLPQGHAGAPWRERARAPSNAWASMVRKGCMQRRLHSCMPCHPSRRAPRPKSRLALFLVMSEACLPLGVDRCLVCADATCQVPPPLPPPLPSPLSAPHPSVSPPARPAAPR
jgi:hypothetical protein